MNTKLKDILIFPVRLVFPYDKPQEDQQIISCAFYEGLSLLVLHQPHSTMIDQITDDSKMDFK